MISSGLRVDEVQPGRPAVREVGGRRIAVFNVDGRFFAVADRCPHAGAVIADGELDGVRLTCPLHGAVFDVRTGAVLRPPANDPLTVFEVRVVDATLWLEP